MNKKSNRSFLKSEIIISSDNHDNLWKVPGFLLNNQEKWAQTLVKVYQHPMSFPGSVSPQMGNLLRALILNIEPVTVMEIGAYIGVSTLWIASAMAEYTCKERIHCIDLFPDHTDNPWCPGTTLINPKDYIARNLRNSHLEDLVKFYQGDSQLVIDKAAEDFSSAIDFAFIDGDHSLAGCLADLKKVEPYLNEGGYLLFHDVFPRHCGVDGPFQVLQQEIASRGNYEICQIYTSPLNFGFALVRKLSD